MLPFWVSFCFFVVGKSLKISLSAGASFSHKKQYSFQGFGRFKSSTALFPSSKVFQMASRSAWSLHSSRHSLLPANFGDAFEQKLFVHSAAPKSHSTSLEISKSLTVTKKRIQKKTLSTLGPVKGFASSSNSLGSSGSGSLAFSSCRGSTESDPQTTEMTSVSKIGIPKRFLKMWKWFPFWKEPK